MSTDGSKPLKCATHEHFALRVVSGETQTEAMRQVYPRRAKDWDNESLHVAASKLAAHNKVKPRIEYLKQGVAKAAQVTSEQVLEAWNALAFTDLPDIVYYDGKATLTVTDFEHLTKAQRACIKEVKFRREFPKGDKKGHVDCVELKFYDKQRALESLSKYLGLYAKDNQREITGADGGPIEVAGALDFSLLDIEEAEAMHALAKKAQVKQGD